MWLFASAKYEVFNARFIRKDLFDVVHIFELFLFDHIQ